MTMMMTMYTQQQQQEARERLNQLAALLDPSVRQLHPLPRPDLVLQALEAARAFVPAELESVLDTILDGYTVTTARNSLARLYAQDLPMPTIARLSFVSADPCQGDDEPSLFAWFLPLSRCL